MEEFSEWITDKTGFKGEIPNIKDMEYTDNLTAYTERKIFTLNTVMLYSLFRILK